MASSSVLPSRSSRSRRIRGRIVKAFTFKRESKRLLLDELGPDNPGTVTEIRLYSMSVGDDRVWKISQSLRVTSCQVRTLNLSHNCIGENGCFALALAFRENSSLERVILGFNDLGPAGIVSLAESFTNNTKTSIRSLALPQTQMSDEGARALANALKQPTSRLQELFLQSNHIGNNGAACLADALRVNGTLVALDLSDNVIGDQGINSFLEGVAHNTMLRNLMLGDNRFSLDWLQQLVALAQRNSTLQILDVRAHHQHDRVTALMRDPDLHALAADDRQAKHALMYKQISYYMTLNQSGRRLIQSNPHPGLLPYLLSHSQWNSDVLYGLIQEQPHLFSSS